MNEDRIIRVLPVELTREERHERSMELAEKIAEARQLESQKKERAAIFKSHEEKLKTRCDLLSEAIKSGREGREVECLWSRNDTYQRMELARLDTGEIIESRPLTAAEKQVAMFPAAVPDAPKKAKKTGSGEN